MATIDDIRKRLKQEGYDERAVAYGGRNQRNGFKRFWRL
jgi:hypothetical protein